MYFIVTYHNLEEAVIVRIYCIIHSSGTFAWVYLTHGNITTLSKIMELLCILVAFLIYCRRFLINMDCTRIDTIIDWTTGKSIRLSYYRTCNTSDRFRTRGRTTRALTAVVISESREWYRMAFFRSVWKYFAGDRFVVCNRHDQYHDLLNGSRFRGQVMLDHDLACSRYVIRCSSPDTGSSNLVIINELTYSTVNHQ